MSTILYVNINIRLVRTGQLQISRWWAHVNVQTVGQYEYADGRLILIPRCSPDDNTESGTLMFKYAVAELN
jgi:hypothetical protein